MPMNTGGFARIVPRPSRAHVRVIDNDVDAHTKKSALP
jgi:hypothetical protein